MPGISGNGAMGPIGPGVGVATGSGRRGGIGVSNPSLVPEAPMRLVSPGSSTPRLGRMISGIGRSSFATV